MNCISTETLKVKLFHIGVVSRIISILSRMAARPLMIPYTHSGERSCNQWQYNLQNVVAVNDWDEEAQLKWFKV